MCDEIGGEVYDDVSPEVTETFDDPVEIPEPEEIFEPELPDIPEPEIPDFELPEPELPDIPEPEIPDFELPEPELPESELPEIPDVDLEEPETDLFTEEQSIGNDIGDDFDDDDDDDGGDDGREYEEDDVDHDDIELDEDEEIELEEQDDEKDLEDIGLDEDEEIKLEEQSDEEQLEDIGLEETPLDSQAESKAPSSQKDDEGPGIGTRIVAGVTAATVPFAVGELANLNAQQALDVNPTTEIVQEYDAPEYPEGSIEAQIDAQLQDHLDGNASGPITITIPAGQIPDDYKIEGTDTIEAVDASAVPGADATLSPDEAKVELIENYLDMLGEVTDGMEKSDKAEELMDDMLQAQDMERVVIPTDAPDRPIDLSDTKPKDPASSSDDGRPSVFQRIVAGGLAATVPFAAMEVAQFDTQQAMDNINRTEIVQEYEAPAHPEGSIEAQIDAQLDDLLSGRSDKPLTITIPADSIPEGAKINDSENVTFTIAEDVSESRVDPEEARVEFLRNYLDAMGEWADGRIKDQELQDKYDMLNRIIETEPDPLVGDPPEGYDSFDYRTLMDDKDK